MLLELRQLVTAEAAAAARRRESGGAPPGAARHVLAKLQAQLEAADPTELSLPHISLIPPYISPISPRRSSRRQM